MKHHDITSASAVLYRRFNQSLYELSVMNQRPHPLLIVSITTLALFATGCCCSSKPNPDDNLSQRQAAYDQQENDQNDGYQSQTGQSSVRREDTLRENPARSKTRNRKTIIRDSAFAVVKVLNLGMPRLARGSNNKIHTHKNRFPVVIPSAGHGSGVVISNKCLVVTNEHVTNGASSLAVRFEDVPQTFAARLIAKSKKYDVALLQVDRPSCKYTMDITTPPTDLQRGSDVWKLGYGGEVPAAAMRARQAAVKQGSFSRSVPDGNGGQRYEISAPINGGDSGGLLIDEQGAFIGVLVSKLRKSDGVGFVIPGPTVFAIVKEAAQKGLIKRERDFIKTRAWQTHKQLSSVAAKIVETDIKNIIRGNLTKDEINSMYKIVLRDIKSKNYNNATVAALVTLSSAEWNYSATLYSLNKTAKAKESLGRSMDLVNLAVKINPAIVKNEYVSFMLLFQRKRKQMAQPQRRLGQLTPQPQLAQVGDFPTLD